MQIIGEGTISMQKVIGGLLTRPKNSTPLPINNVTNKKFKRTIKLSQAPGNMVSKSLKCNPMNTLNKSHKKQIDLKN